MLELTGKIGVCRPRWTKNDWDCL